MRQLIILTALVFMLALTACLEGWTRIDSYPDQMRFKGVTNTPFHDDPMEEKR